MFVFSHAKNQFKNLVTLSELARSSNGNLFYYPEFDQTQHGLKFTNELYHVLTRQMAWESVFRVRISNGWREVISLGNVTIK